MLNPNQDRNKGPNSNGVNSKGGKTDCFPVQDISHHLFMGGQGVHRDTISISVKWWPWVLTVYSRPHIDDAVLIRISKSLRQIVVP